MLRAQKPSQWRERTSIIGLKARPHWQLGFRGEQSFLVALPLYFYCLPLCCCIGHAAGQALHRSFRIQVHACAGGSPRPSEVRKLPEVRKLGSLEVYVLNADE